MCTALTETESWEQEGEEETIEERKRGGREKRTRGVERKRARECNLTKKKVTR